MAKFKISAGAEVDLLTASEVRDALKEFRTNWTAEFSRGRRSRRFSAQGTVTAAGDLVIGGSGVPDFGPEQGMVWSVRRLAITGFADDTDVVGVFVNDASPSQSVEPGLMIADNALDGLSVRWSNRQLVLQSGETLLVAGASLTAASIWTVAGQTDELPAALEWMM